MRQPLLTDAEQAQVRAALNFLHARIGTWAWVSQVVRSKRKNIRRVRAGERINGMRALAGRIGKIFGVSMADVLEGRFVPDGICQHCGRAEPLGSRAISSNKNE